MVTPEILREHADAAAIAAGHTPNAARRRRMYARAYAYTALAAAEQLHALPAEHESDREQAEAALTETQCWQAVLSVAAGLPPGRA